MYPLRYDFIRFRPIAVIRKVPQSSDMARCRTLLLALVLSGCGQGETNPTQITHLPDTGLDVRSEFLRLTARDPWVKWPDMLRENPADEGQPCERVTEQSRDEAIALLSDEPAVAIDARRAQALTGAATSEGGGDLYLLRGFSSTNSTSRVKVTGNGVTVHSDALGGLFNLRRHPCVAVLRGAPIEVFTVAAYDL